MNKLRFVLCLLFTLVTAMVFGQTAEDILKQELKKHLVNVVEEVCSIMEYSNTSALDRLKQNGFDDFYEALKNDQGTAAEVTAFRLLMKDATDGLMPISTEGNLNDLEKLAKFSKKISDLIKKKPSTRSYIQHLKNQDDKRDNITAEYVNWDTFEKNLRKDYDAFKVAEENEEWKTFLNNVKTDSFKDLATKKQKEQKNRQTAEEQKRQQTEQENKEYQAISNLKDYSEENLQQCEAFLENFPNSQYAEDVKEKITYLAKKKPTHSNNNANSSQQIGTSSKDEPATHSQAPKTVDPLAGTYDTLAAKPAAAPAPAPSVPGFDDENDDELNENSPSKNNPKDSSKSPESNQKKEKEKEKSDASLYLWLALALFAVLVTLLIIVLSRKKKEEVVPLPQPQKPVEKESNVTETTQPNNGSREPEHKKEPLPEPKPQSKSSESVVTSPIQGSWVLVGASVRGNGHIQSDLPCQDNNKYEELEKGWGIAIVSDGAGSAAHSDMGSKIVVERGLFHFKKLIQQEGWMDKNTLPSDAEWLSKSYSILRTMRDEVDLVAKKNNVPIKELSATCLVVLFSPIGLLTVHIGDGRMGCKPVNGAWKTIMTPHKGEEANQTIFLVSDFWNIPNYVQSGILVPESIVVREPVEAFALMSDGCEATAWLCTAQNPETGMYYDKNQPFEGFFNPVIETLKSFDEDQVPVEERNAKWYKFIESGMKSFVREQDDKTMIVGVLVERNE